SDAGTPGDAGTLGDAGTPAPDAGAPGDAGTPATDAGASDSGIDLPNDGGTSSGCTGCGQCGDLACIIEPGMSSGMCEACTSDLDCCAPYVCISGSCRLNF
ncbi:hypothetical protein L6R52_27480, partial [Myxococcota bacterium]|nr:hypothetical protein [Myxococcota bacterium]